MSTSLDRLVSLSKHGGWVGVDFDGTLSNHGRPIPRMVERVRTWARAGVNVRIFTARTSDEDVAAITQWCDYNVGHVFPVTDRKDHLLIECWDDRAVQVIPNTGERADRAEES